MSLHDYDVQCPVFMFFMAKPHRFFFPNKQRFLKQFNSRRIHPCFIFLKLFDSNYCNEVRRNARYILNDIFAAIAVLYLEFFNTKEFKAPRQKRDATFLIWKKVLPLLFLSLLVLCPTQWSNSDVHLTVGYLLAKALNSVWGWGWPGYTKVAAFNVWIILSAVFPLLYQSWQSRPAERFVD